MYFSHNPEQQLRQRFFNFGDAIVLFTTVPLGSVPRLRGQNAAALPRDHIAPIAKVGDLVVILRDGTAGGSLSTSSLLTGLEWTAPSSVERWRERGSCCCGRGAMSRPYCRVSDHNRELRQRLKGAPFQTDHAPACFRNWAYRLRDLSGQRATGGKFGRAQSSRSQDQHQMPVDVSGWSMASHRTPLRRQIQCGESLPTGSSYRDAGDP